MTDEQNINPDDDNIEEFPFADDQELESGEAENESVEQEAIDPLAALEQENGKLKDQLLRAVAEMENIRKRAVKDRDDASKYGVTNLAKELLAVADNLGRAMEAIPEELIQDNDAIANLVTGVKATQDQLHGAMQKSGIQKIDAQPGTLFDPNIHEVMFEAGSPDHTPGAIIQVMETGYMIHDRLLRPARVGVAKKSNSAPEPSVNVEA